MIVSVILCSYNRCGSLATALESIAASKLPDSMDWEVLVIDNNSSDKTREVAQGFCQRFPNRFHYFFEPRQGKSFALNTGIQAARGEVLAFTDDDVIVEPTWLFEISEPLRGEEWAGAGGRIRPARKFTPPKWLNLEGEFEMGGQLVLFDRGDASIELSVPPFGANMAFRSAIFKEYGGFRTDLGPEGTAQIRGEDTEFCERLTKAGCRMYYVPSAIVYHEIPEYRLKKSFFLPWWIGKGVAQIRSKKPQPPMWAGIPSQYRSIGNRVLNRIPKASWRWIWERDPKMRFFLKCQVWMLAGETKELFAQSRRQNGTR
jgi:glycosyltransferase involved in cell wall biosynthesis